ncbi:MAG: EamA family transporter [Alphaproteobacteria bacterium]|nr:EamA family transporter [Alphaproteobacteria bacterium]
MDESPSKKSSETPPGFVSLATAGALMTVLLWGGSSMATKLGTDSMDTLTLGVLRVVAAGPFALILIIVMRLRLPWHTQYRLHFTTVAIVGMALAPLLFTIGVQFTTAGHAVVASSSTSIFTGLIEAAARRHWPRLRWWIGIAVAFAGALILIAESLGLGSTGATWQGDLLVMSAAFCGSTGFYLGSRLSMQYGAPAVTLWSLVFACVLLIPVLAIASSFSELLQLTVLNWSVVIYLAAGASVIATITWFYALSRGGISRMAVWQFALPIVGIALAAIVLGEPVTWLLVASVAVILSGIALVQWR